MRDTGRDAGRKIGTSVDAAGDAAPPAFGALLRRHRLDAGLTQEALAERAELGVRTLQGLERGENHPQAETVRHLVHALGLSGAPRTRFEAAAQPTPRRTRHASRAPPPRAASGPAPTNLPAQLTSFVGRDAELRRVEQLLAATRLLTLTGPGGVGKTRLAQQAAASLLGQFEGGVYFVPLASVTDPELVLPAVARTLGVPEGTGRSLPAALKAVLAARPVLLVLDNLEQVLPAAPLVADLLVCYAHLQVLATSRAVLRLSGEQEFPVPPLALPVRQDAVSPGQASRCEAVVLFAERAKAVRPDFVLTSENVQTVLAICWRLDGLPLAIELAAALIRVLPLPALLDRLQRRLPLLTGGPRDAPARQRTLRDTIAWSHDLLGPAERTIFRRAAVFRGCTLDAVEAVCCASAGGPGTSSTALPPVAVDALVGVTALVEQSLLVREETADGEPRYVMLETLQEFALERLAESGENAAVRRRHALYFLRLAEEADRAIQEHEQVAALDRLEGEHDNCREALRWCAAQGYAEPALRMAAALWWFWSVRGHIGEGRDHLTSLLDRFPLPPERTDRSRALLHARVLRAAGHLASFQADLEAARALLEQALRIAEGADDSAGVADALLGLAFVARQRGDRLAARPSLVQQPLGVAAGGEPAEIFNALYVLGSLAHDEGDYGRARELLEEGLALERVAARQGHAITPHVVGDYHLLLGVVALDRGDHLRARAEAEQALALYEAVGDRRRSAVAHVTLGGVATAQGDHAAASAHLGKSLRVAWEVGDPGATAAALEWLAVLASRRGEAARALRLAGSAAALREKSGTGLAPAAQQRIDTSLKGARDALGPPSAAAAHAAGRALRAEDAVAEGLAVSDCE